MKIALMVSDNDTAYAFLNSNVEEHPPGCQPFELILGGVTFKDIIDEEKTVWLQSETTLTVVNRETFDFDEDNDDRWPVPTPLICLGRNDFNTLMKQQ